MSFGSFNHIRLLFQCSVLSVCCCLQCGPVWECWRPTVSTMSLRSLSWPGPALYWRTVASTALRTSGASVRRGGARYQVRQNWMELSIKGFTSCIVLYCSRYIENNMLGAKWKQLVFVSFLTVTTSRIDCSVLDKTILSRLTELRFRESILSR